METFKSVVGYEGLYEVGELGSIVSLYCNRSNQGGVLKTKRHPAGYRAINLYNGEGMKTKLVHVIVAEAFLGPRPDGHVINHINGNKADNRAVNIEYTTQSENVRHAHRLKLIPRSGPPKGEANVQSKLTYVIAAAIRAERPMTTVKDLAQKYNVSMATIERVIYNKTWVA